MIDAWTTLPEAFCARAAALLPPAALDAFKQAFAHQPPMAVRWNGDGPLPDDVLDALTTAGVAPRPMSWFADGVHCDTGDRSMVRALPAHADGTLVLQSASSMFAALCVQAQPGEDVLDMCAAPGGKTALLHRSMQGRGRLVANDLSRARTARLRDQLAALHVEGVQMLTGDGVALARDLPQCFDRVLVDAPCSGEGRWHVGQPHDWQSWSLSTVRGLAKRQRTLLKAATDMVRPGGVIVYSTCTLAPEENEGVVAHACKDGRLTIDPITPVSEAMVPGMCRWGDVTWPDAMAGTCRIHHGVDGFTGFFVARLRRT